MKRSASDNTPVSPDDLRLIKISEVMNMCGLSRSGLYTLIQQGAFPRPVKLSVRSSAWVKSEVQEWMEARMRARDIPPRR